MRTDLPDGSTVEIVGGMVRRWRAGLVVAEREATPEDEAAAAAVAAGAEWAALTEGEREQLAAGIEALEAALQTAAAMHEAALLRTTLVDEWREAQLARAALVRGMSGTATPAQIVEELARLHERDADIAGHIVGMSDGQSQVVSGLVLAYRDLIAIARILRRRPPESADG